MIVGEEEIIVVDLDTLETMVVDLDPLLLLDEEIFPTLALKVDGAVESKAILERPARSSRQFETQMAGRFQRITRVHMRSLSRPRRPPPPPSLYPMCRMNRSRNCMRHICGR